MKKIISSFIISALLLELFGCTSSYTIDTNDYTENDLSMNKRIAGAKVFLGLNNGLDYIGELLSVRDSTMLLCEQCGASEEDLSNLVFQIDIIKNHNIELMEIQGKSKILTWVAIGGAAGAAVGIVLDPTEDDDDLVREIVFPKALETCLYGCVFGAAGVALGFIAGAFSSIRDKEVYTQTNVENFDFTKLNIFSRYQGDEPEYLREIK